MNKEELVSLVEYLDSAQKEGYKIVTWNGLGRLLRFLSFLSFPIFAIKLPYIRF